MLDTKAMSVSDEKGKVLCTVWACKALETKATADQAKAGLKYAHLEQTTLVGAVQFPDMWKDYRKQNIKAGVYTLRIGIQPEDGDHQGTAPFNEFCLLSPGRPGQEAGRDRAEGTARAEHQVHDPQAPRGDAAVPEQDPGRASRRSRPSRRTTGC